MSSDDEPNVVDFDVLEAAKENVQPLATGRRVTALAGLLATPHAQRDAKLSATRNRLRINVEIAMEDEDGDPLEAYCRLVYWTLESYPQGHSAESGLLELLEEATRALKDFNGGAYKSDMKYLKLWLLYASYVDRPTIVYRFLLANNIGVDFALLYEEHAAVLERDGRKQEADEVYALGIARKAQPLEHLETRYQDFQKRMISTFSPSAPDAPPAPPPTAAKPKRQILGTTSQAATASSSRPRELPLATAPSRPAPFEIFSDPSGQAGEAGESESGWADLGTRQTRVKENVPETKKVAGTTIKQAKPRVTRGASSSTVAPPAPRIVPFRDPVEPPAAAAPSPPPPPATTLRKAPAASSSRPAPPTTRRVAGSSGTASSRATPSAAASKPSVPSKLASSSRLPSTTRAASGSSSKLPPNPTTRPPSGSSTKLAIFQDPAPSASSSSRLVPFEDPTPTPRTRSSSKTAPGKQPAPTPRAPTAPGGPKTKLAIFKDPTPQPRAPPSSSKQPKLAIFKDPVSSAATPSGSSSNPKITPFEDPKPAAFVPYVDDTSASPTKSRFIPFRDEELQADCGAEGGPLKPAPRLGLGASGDSVIKVKKAGIREPEPTSEAEALRKDPLKNYT